MGRKAFSLLMLTSLLVSMLLIGIGTVRAAGYTPGAGTKYTVKIDPPYDTGVPPGLNWTGPPPGIGEKFNVSVYIENITEMIGYVFTLVWNNSICNATGNIWDWNPWGVAPAGRMGFGYILGTYGNYGYVDSVGDSLVSTYYQYNFTDNTATQHKLFTVEFNVKALGDNWFYVYKQSGTREPEFTLIMLTPSGWMKPTSPIGQSEDYDVIWLVEGNRNADIYIVPEFLAHLFMALFLIATIIAVVLRKTAWSKGPRGRMDVK